MTHSSLPNVESASSFATFSRQLATFFFFLFPWAVEGPSHGRDERHIQGPGEEGLPTSGWSTSTGAATASASVGLAAASAAGSLFGDCDADFGGERRGLEPGIVVRAGACSVGL
jgi:hypothetical protein